MPTQYKLTGVAFVPVQVEMIVSASSKKAARNKAKKAFVQQARNTLRKAFCLTKGWHLMDIRTRRILDNPEYFLSLYTGEAVLDNPPQCAECGTWEAPLFGNQQGAQRGASCGGLSRQKTLAKK